MSIMRIKRKLKAGLSLLQKKSKEGFAVLTFPCMKMPVRSSCTWKPTYTLARLMVGDHHRVKRRLGI